MSTDVQQGRKGIDQHRQYLAYRETIILSLALLEPHKLTQQQFYSVYHRIHDRLSKVGIIEFPLPVARSFQAMVRKLIKNEDLRQIYSQDNYVLELTDQGKGTFEVIYAMLERHNAFERVLNVYNFYRQTIVS